ncbi:MAG TPA: S9 family peptidase [Nocardioides sp.]|uniref:S9 family peptidase n=1 Tax=Nocardioides sp. TaxID=35761 RepID=UPI002E304F1E|nr:S9 family peptidase [Nocardioides sp.]HEX3931170.1 S9 family peptidase [Nocardioides sp.]
MSLASRPTTTFEATEAGVRDHLTRCQTPGPRAIEDIAQVAPHPSGRLVACTVTLRQRPMTPVQRRIAVVDLSADDLTVLDLPHDDCAWPEWSADGSRLVLVGTSDEGAAAVVLQGEPHELTVTATSGLPGFVERALWSPDGTRLALQVAMPGAEISDVHGSGTLGGADHEAWRPRVAPDPGAGRRLAFLWDPDSRESRALSELTVWELAWSGPDALLALTSEEPDENAWYGARLTRLDVRRPGHETLLVPEHQLSAVASTRSGARWSVLRGLQSDRGLPAGTLVVGGEGELPKDLDTRGVHVTDQHWLDERSLLVTGLRGLHTVVATVDVGSGALEELWAGQQTSGEYFPQVAGLAGHDPLVVLESHREAPCLGVLRRTGFRPVLAVEGPGSLHQARSAGSISSMTWPSSDGLEIEGLLIEPDGGPRPHPLVLQVHGGPTHAYRDTWLGRDPHTSSLVARGYAVLWPNPRGSSGRGAAFAEAVRGDMGGLDVDDLVAGVRHLVDLGIADPARLGITGISYGGFMSAWVPARTGLFAAAVARSPCTDWLLQHLTSNIAEFDRRFLDGEPFDPESQYVERSPLRHLDSIHTPLLLTAGSNDLATPPSQAQVLHTALRERGVDTQLVIYPDEGHGVRHPLSVVDQCARMVAWFDRYLRGD